jgi:hypothetical protein
MLGVMWSVCVRGLVLGSLRPLCVVCFGGFESVCLIGSPSLSVASSSGVGERDIFNTWKKHC